MEKLSFQSKMMKLQPSIHYSVKWMSNRRLLLLTGIISFSFGLFIVIGAIKGKEKLKSFFYI